MEQATTTPVPTPTDSDVSGARSRGVVRCPTTRGSLIDPRIEALGMMHAGDRAALSAAAKHLSITTGHAYIPETLHSVLMSLCEPHTALTGDAATWFAKAAEFKQRPGCTAPDPLRSPGPRSAYFTPAGVLTPEGRRVLHTMSETMAAAFRPIALAARRASAQFGPLAALLQEAKRGPTIGRKRRARRARGQARQAKNTARSGK